MAESSVQPYPQTPVLETPIAAIVLVANIILPGAGTLTAGIVGQQRLIGRAVAQLLLAIVIVGYVWGIITGIQALTNASWGAKNKAPAAAEPAMTEKPKAKAAPAAKTAKASPASKPKAKKT